MTRSELKTLFKCWAINGHIERHRFPIFSKELKNGLTLLTLGFFVGFTFACIVIAQINGG